MQEAGVLRIGTASYAHIKKLSIDIAARTLRPAHTDPRRWLSCPAELTQIFTKITMLLLEIIRNAEPASVSDLARIAKLKTSNVSRALHRLEEFGMVELKPGPGKKRAPRVTFERYTVEGAIGGNADFGDAA